MNRHSRVALVAAGALGAMLAAGLWAMVAARSGQVCHLPDGSTVTLEAVTYGKVHPWMHGTWWQKQLYPILSPALRNWSGLWKPQTGWAMGDFLTREPNDMVLHVFRRGVGARGRMPLHAVACDDRGRELDSGWEAGGLLVPLSDGVEEAWEVPVFPRRGSSVRVRVYGHVPGNRLVPVTEFVAPNPTPGPFPIWKPQPLPTTKRAGDLAVTLTRIATGAPPDVPPPRSIPGEEAWTRAAFRIKQNGRATTNWSPIAATVSDATGNVWMHRNERPAMTNGEIDLQFSGSLPSTETAWKLRVELSQTAGFTPADLWSLRGLPIPKRDQLIDPAATARRHGAELRLGLAGPGDPLKVGWFYQPTSTMSVRVSPSSPSLQLTLVGATDDEDRPHALFGGGPASLGSGKYLYFLDRSLLSARKMNLLFAVHRNRFVEFLVAPPRG